MRVLRLSSRALALAVVLALSSRCCSCWGATLGGNAIAAPAFTAPLLAGAGDLGDVPYNAHIVKFLNCSGGVRPYRFTSNLSTVLAGSNSSLQLGQAGLLSGITPAAGGMNAIAFTATVTDAVGGTATANFNLNLVNPAAATPPVFRFGTNTLPAGYVTDSYACNLGVVGGVAPYTFSITAFTSGGKPVTAPNPNDPTTPLVLGLDDIGLSLSTDGTIQGKPLLAGTFSITVECQDSTSLGGTPIPLTAKDRTNAVNNQIYALTINADPSTASDITTVLCSVKGGSPSRGLDTLKYNGYINALGAAPLNLLNCDVSFLLGGVGFSGRLNRDGVYAAKTGKHSHVYFAVDTKNGTVQIKMTGGSFDNALGVTASNFTGSTVWRRSVQVAVGALVYGSDSLDLAVSQSSSGYGLNYVLGAVGDSASGGFEIVGVKGKDMPTTDGTQADAWRLDFVMLPAVGAALPAGAPATETQWTNFDDATSVAVRIGTAFSTPTTTSFALQTAKGILSFSGGSNDGVAQFLYDTQKFTGSIDTAPLSAAVTGILPAAAAASEGVLFFPLGIDVQALAADGKTVVHPPFTGQQGRRILGRQTQFKDSVR